MKSLEIENFLTNNTNFLNITLQLNDRIESYEECGIETPKHIQEILTDLKICANLIFVSSDCATIAKSFNESEMYLYKAFYIKSIFRTVYESFKKVIADELGKPIQTGVFGADMKVALLNDGPVTILIDSKNKE